MQKIYEIGGILSKGFVGQISYTVCLNRVYSEMNISFSFDEEKQRYKREEISDIVKRDFINACDGNYAISPLSSEDLTDTILDASKTEIHTIAYMNDYFIGGIHKQLTERHMIYQPGSASEGCLALDSVHGVIKLTLIVFNVIKDDTYYHVSLFVNGGKEDV